jgi:hypothetical protein
LPYIRFEDITPASRSRGHACIGEIMERIGVFSDGALFRRLAFLDRAERELYQSILTGGSRAEAHGPLPNAGPQYERLCASVREVREHMGRVEEELLRRRAAAMPQAA